MQFDVKINLLTGAVILDTMTAVSVSAGLASGTTDTSSQTLDDIRAYGYKNNVSSTEGVNYSPYIIGSIQLIEQV